MRCPAGYLRRDRFRTGLDHFAFGVATRAELEDWQRELSSRGITDRKILIPSPAGASAGASSAAPPVMWGGQAAWLRVTV